MFKIFEHFYEYFKVIKNHFFGKKKKETCEKREKKENHKKSVNKTNKKWILTTWAGPSAVWSLFGCANQRHFAAVSGVLGFRQSRSCSWEEGLLGLALDLLRPGSREFNPPSGWVFVIPGNLTFE